MLLAGSEHHEHSTVLCARQLAVLVLGEVLAGSGEAGKSVSCSCGWREIPVCIKQRLDVTCHETSDALSISSAAEVCAGAPNTEGNALCLPALYFPCSLL